MTRIYFYVFLSIRLLRFFIKKFIKQFVQYLKNKNDFKYYRNII